MSRITRMSDRIRHLFLALLQAGLWEKEVRLSAFEKGDLAEVYKLASEQSVVGLVAAGLEHVVDGSFSKSDVLPFMGDVIRHEGRNRAMNAFIADLFSGLNKEGIHTVLVKGQGIAQCYERPLWRASGDIDLFLDEAGYNKAKKYLIPIADKVEDEQKYNLHLEMSIKTWPVELHGTLRAGLWKSLDRIIDSVQIKIFDDGEVRSWNNSSVDIPLPAVDNDVFLVFSHILQHFFKEGIGLRQICDWCRLLWTNKETLDVELLEARLKEAGVASEWKAFAALAVEYLGMPKEAMPLYSDSGTWKRKAAHVMDFVFETGIFGHNRDYSYRQKYSFVVFKAISLWRHIVDTFKYSLIFPLDSVKVLAWRIGEGIAEVGRGK